jgi:hypothetical protein
MKAMTVIPLLNIALTGGKGLRISAVRDSLICLGLWLVDIKVIDL